MTSHSSDDTVLMIRMWREPGLPHDGMDWRGRVDVLTEGRRRLFVGADSLLRILNDCLSARSTSPPETSDAATRATVSDTHPENHENR